MVILPGDTLARCIMFARFFQNSIHVNEVLFVFGATKDDGASHESAVLRSLAPEDTDVHRIGCSIAAGQNTKAGNPPSGPKRKYYCGFRSAMISKILLQGEFYEVRLTLDNEGGEPAHVDVALFVAGETRNERANNRTVAGLALAEAFGPACEHVCDIERNNEEHPLIKDPECLRKGLKEIKSINQISE